MLTNRYREVSSDYEEQNRLRRKTQLTKTALHAYACDCVTHQLFHPYGSNCLQNKDDEEMMHQVAADDSLQSKLSYAKNRALELTRELRPSGSVL